MPKNLTNQNSSSVIKSTTSSLVDTVERILDKGIVIDAWVSVSVIGIELLTIEARVIVASVETYVKYAAVLGYLGPVAGGLREPTKRKSLGEGLQDVSQGLQSTLQSVPALGSVGQTVQGATGGVMAQGRERQATTTRSSKQNRSKRGGRKKTRSRK